MSTAIAAVPGLTQLEAMPGIIRKIVSGVTEKEARWKPSPERWSIAEVLGHLAHVEAQGFRGRVERILSENNPLLPGYDPDKFAATGAYEHQDLAAAFDAYERERLVSLEVLKAIPTVSLARPAVHGELGPLTLSNLLHEWPFHDIGHLRQISELVRAVSFYQRLGPWQKFYSLHP
jgi:hypothetical protein